MYLWSWRKQKNALEARKLQRAESKRRSTDLSLHEVSEWQGPKEGLRSVKVKCDVDKKAILVFADPNTRKPTRTLSCKDGGKMFLKESVDKQRNYLLIRVPREYDLVIMFDDIQSKNSFMDSIRQFGQAVGLNHVSAMVKEKELLKEAITKSRRQALLDKFFRVVFNHVSIYNILSLSISAYFS